MANDLRAAVQELLNALDKVQDWDTTRVGDAMDAVEIALLAATEAVGVTDEELEDFAYEHGGGFYNCDCQEEADMLARKHVATYRLLLSRFAHPAPVPVGERLPGVGDCDAEGRCFFYHPDLFWMLEVRTYGINVGRTHWLPHWALPLPGAEP
jgi:hypothetical protein